MNSRANHVDLWPKEREGYEETIVPAYAPAPKGSVRYPTSVRTEERIGSVIAGVGVIFMVKSVTHNLAGITHMGILPPGPLETCAIGVLIWLHGKWRRATKLR
ncbi:MAG: hypothetical protein JOZ44_08975 [Acidobacteria bacterium]|nr:hypothetical protein [Acidobacteriota bacterium]